jgi:manganese transport protein
MGTFVPSVPNQEAFYIALGILGATVMPHNLYLHSALVQTRDIAQTSEGKWHAIRYNTLDTVIALGAAFFVNAAILVLSAAVFHATGNYNVEDLGEAHRLLTPLLGTSVAATAFAVALLASGQSSTITGTLAGQIVMEGFMHIRLKPWLRRIISRLLAIVPAIILIQATNGRDTVGLLILSQVVLSMQLPFAIFPLLMFTSNPKYMGEFANSTAIKYVGYVVCTVIAALNVYLLFQIIGIYWLSAIATVAVAFALWVTFIYQEKNDDKETGNKSAA